MEMAEKLKMRRARDFCCTGLQLAVLCGFGADGFRDSFCHGVWSRSGALRARQGRKSSSLDSATSRRPGVWWLSGVSREAAGSVTIKEEVAAMKIQQIVRDRRARA